MAIIVEAMTTTATARPSEVAQIRQILREYGRDGLSILVLRPQGVIVIDNEDGDLDEDTVLSDALDAGAQDLVTQESVYEVYTTPEDFSAVNDALDAKGYKFLSAQTEMVPQNYVKLTDPEDVRNMEKMLELLEESDDVQNVWHNWEQE